MDDLNNLLGANSLQRVTAPLAQAGTLPPTAYTNPKIFDAERSKIFARSWQCVARAEQLTKPGDYVAVDLPGQPVVVVCDQTNTLRAFANVCLHRAMPLATGCGNARRFVCPYHNWTYELNGSLRSAPMMDGAADFNASTLELPPLAVEVWNGFVFVNPDPEAAALAPQLTGLDALIKRYRFTDLRVVDTLYFDSPWNWKILTENFMEAYHHIGTHRQTFEPVYPARESSVPDNGGSPWAFLWMPGAESNAEPATSFPHLNTAEHSGIFAACVFPTFLFAASAGAGAWYQLQPRGYDKMDLHIHVLLSDAISKVIDEGSLTELRESFRTVHLEDIEANEGPWRGLQAMKTTQGRLSPYEKAVWQLNQLWVNCMTDPSHT